MPRMQMENGLMNVRNLVSKDGLRRKVIEGIKNGVSSGIKEFLNRPKRQTKKGIN